MVEFVAQDRFIFRKQYFFKVTACSKVRVICNKRKAWNHLGADSVAPAASTEVQYDLI